jgi:hypothetical protein
MRSVRQVLMREALREMGRTYERSAEHLISWEYMVKIIECADDHTYVVRFCDRGVLIDGVCFVPTDTLQGLPNYKGEPT